MRKYKSQLKSHFLLNSTIYTFTGSVYAIAIHFKISNYTTHPFPIYTNIFKDPSIIYKKKAEGQKSRNRTKKNKHCKSCG